MLVAMLILSASVHGGPVGQPLAGARTEPDRVAAAGASLLAREINTAVLESLRSCGIVVPFPQREVRLNDR